MLEISDPTFEAMAERQRSNFLQQVGQLVEAKSGISAKPDALSKLLNAANARGLTNEQDCATFIALIYILQQNSKLAEWANRQASLREPLVMSEFAQQVRTISAAHQ